MRDKNDIQPKAKINDEVRRKFFIKQ